MLMVLVSWTLTAFDWEMPRGAPSIQISMLVIAGSWLISTITAVVGRHNLRRLRTTGGLVKLAVSAVVLGGGMWWVWTVDGIPLQPRSLLCWPGRSVTAVATTGVLR